MMTLSEYYNYKPTDSGSFNETQYNLITGSFDPWLRQYIGYGSESTSSLSIGLNYGIAESLQFLYKSYYSTGSLSDLTNTNISSETLGDHSISYTTPTITNIEGSLFKTPILAYFQPFRKARFL